MTFFFCLSLCFYTGVLSWVETHYGLVTLPYINVTNSRALTTGWHKVVFLVIHGLFLFYFCRFVYLKYKWHNTCALIGDCYVAYVCHIIGGSSCFGNLYIYCIYVYPSSVHGGGNFPGFGHARPPKVKGTPERVYYYYFFYNSLPLLLFLLSWVFFRILFFVSRLSRESNVNVLHRKPCSNTIIQADAAG